MDRDSISTKDAEETRLSLKAREIARQVCEVFPSRVKSETADRAVVWRPVGVDDLFQQHRGPRHVPLMRQLAMYILHRQGAAYSAVGRAFDRDRTTVRHGCQHVEEVARYSGTMRDAIEKLLAAQ